MYIGKVGGFDVFCIVRLFVLFLCLVNNLMRKSIVLEIYIVDKGCY